LFAHICHATQNMKILFVNTRHFPGGGDSTYTFNLSELLRRRGHDTAFFAMEHPGNLPDPNSDLFVTHIDFRELNLHKNLFTGMKVLSRVIYSSEAHKKFGKMIDRFRPDIVHLQNIHAHITPSVIFEANRNGIPVVWTLHDYKIICPNSHFLIDATSEICEACGTRAYYQAAVKRCKKGSFFASLMASIEAYAHILMHVRDKVDMFLAPSAFLRNKLLDRGFSAEKVAHLPLFLPNEMFLNTHDDQGYLLFLGKLDPIKGLHPFLNACREAKGSHVILAGLVDESIANTLPEMLSGNTEYVGMKHGEELRQLIQGSRSLVLPSLCYENQPFSITEAFAAGKPVIASDLGGMSELVGDNQHGILVPPGNIEALANAMNWMTTHPQEANQMGRKARQYAKEMLRADKHYEKLMQVYKKIGELH